MDIKRIKIVFVIILFVFLFPHKGYAREDKRLYSQAIKSARAGDLNFAFMHFHMLLSSYPESRFSESALFAVGEYYFLIADYFNATLTFNRFINKYPQSKAKPFALACLLKIAKMKEKEELAKNLEKEIVGTKQLSFLFRDFKEYEYLSPLSTSYKAVYFIDGVEFYIDEELFTKLSY